MIRMLKCRSSLLLPFCSGRDVEELSFLSWEYDYAPVSVLATQIILGIYFLLGGGHKGGGGPRRTGKCDQDELCEIFK